MESKTIGYGANIHSFFRFKLTLSKLISIKLTSQNFTDEMESMTRQSVTRPDKINYFSEKECSES